MTKLALGNIIALIASILMVYSGLIKNKNKIIYVQTIQIGLFTLSNLILGGFSGAIINFLSCIRNILSYKNKLGLIAKVIISLLMIIFSLKFNNLGFVGLLPLISTIVFIWGMNTNNVILLKLLIMFVSFTWLIYDIYIKSYTSLVFDIANILANSVSIYSIKRKK